MPFRRFTIWSSTITAIAYLALAVTRLVAGRYGYAAIWLIFAIGWAMLARLATKIPAEPKRITTRRVGPLSINRCPERDGTTTTYFDWRGYDDPRHRRITHGKAPVWLPFGTRRHARRIRLPLGRELVVEPRPKAQP